MDFSQLGNLGSMLGNFFNKQPQQGWRANGMGAGPMGMQQRAEQFMQNHPNMDQQRMQQMIQQFMAQRQAMQAGQQMPQMPQMPQRQMMPQQGQQRPMMPTAPQAPIGTPGINPVAPVPSGPGAGVLTPQQIEQIRMMMQGGARF